MATITVEFEVLELRATYHAPADEEAEAQDWTIEETGDPVDNSTKATLRSDLRFFFGPDWKARDFPAPGEPERDHVPDPFAEKAREIERRWPGAVSSVEYEAGEDEDDPDRIY